MIFNKNNNGSAEVKSVLGFTHASLSFENLENFIPFAKKDLVKVIGPEVYKIAEDHYKSEEYQSEEYTDLNQLVKLIQTVIAYNTYRRFVKSNDLSHSETGRQITITETEKPAFEWMVDKDDANLLSLANETFELLLDFLDEQLEDERENEIAAAWMESDAFKTMNSCIVNRVKELEKVVSVNGSRRIYIMLLPYIKKAERTYIPGAIKADRYDSLIEAIKDGELTADQQKMRDLITPVVVNYAMAKALKLIPAEVLPEVFGEKFAADKSESYDTDARLGAAQMFEVEAKSDYSVLQRYIRSLEPVTETDDQETDTTQPFFIC